MDTREALAKVRVLANIYRRQKIQAERDRKAGQTTTSPSAEIARDAWKKLHVRER